MYAQQCPANVGVFICKKSANDELQLLQPALSLETSLSEEDHERLAHAMQAEERDSVLSAAWQIVEKRNLLSPEIPSQKFWGSACVPDRY